MAATSVARATLDDLYREEGKAELIGGRIVRTMASGELPSSVAVEICVSLRAYARSRRKGKAYADGIGFAVPELSSGRESFSPDVSYYDGVLPSNRMRFIEGTPKLAVEVRSENDYGVAAEDQMAEKRADYFLAGTEAVWDVDPEAETITLYLATAPALPITFQRGDDAHAEPALPGWRISVSALFDEA